MYSWIHKYAGHVKYVGGMHSHKRKLTKEREEKVKLENPLLKLKGEGGNDKAWGMTGKPNWNALHPGKRPSVRTRLPSALQSLLRKAPSPGPGSPHSPLWGA